MRFEREMFFYTMAHLRLALSEGFDQVVFARDRDCYGIADVVAVRGKREADEFAALNGDWHIRPLKEFLGTLLQVRTNRPMPVVVETGYYYHHHKTIEMDTNNLKDLREEMKKLGFGEALMVQMEDRILAGEKEFVLHDQVPAQKGHVGIDLHFRQSNRSEMFFLNKLEAIRYAGRGLEAGQGYMVLGKNKHGEVELVTGADSLGGAIKTFRSLSGFKGDVELATGKTLEDRVMLAGMEDGKETYVATEFRKDFDHPQAPQVFWLDRGRGFTREQAANLLQGRAVYKEDLLSREGKPYNAWLQLDMDAKGKGSQQGKEADGKEQDQETGKTKDAGKDKDSGKDKEAQVNLPLKRFNDNYGFELKSVLAEYKIRELDDPQMAERLEQRLKDGHGAMVTVEKDGKPTEVLVETSVRYGKLIFYDLNGGMLKREQFQKVPEKVLEKAVGADRELSKSGKKAVEAGQGMGM